MTKRPSKPTPITRRDRAALVSLEGARLSRVAYHHLPPADGMLYGGGDKGVDHMLAAIDLDLGDRGTAAITWAMAGDLEGLAILEDESYTGVGTELIDASDREAWREHVGQRVTAVAGSWQISGEDCPESLWAIRLDFAVGSIVIALGTAYPQLDYQPDELVVVFDASLARSYQPRHVRDSSWGSPIEH